MTCTFRFLHTSHVRPDANEGFSLLEVSIVIVIIGLLVGGILVGKSLINAAEMRAQINDLQQYQVAVSTFQLKYAAFPGDMSNATAYWGGSTTNGDGNGQIESATIFDDGEGVVTRISPDDGYFDGERPGFFRQLSLSGLVKQQFDGSAVLGKGYPTVRLNPSAGMFASGKWENGDIGNDAYSDSKKIITSRVYMAVVVSDVSDFNDGSSLFNDYSGVLTPEEIWSIDNKVDDGKPASGKVLAHSFSVSPACVLGGTEYNITESSARVCNMLFELVK